MILLRSSLIASDCGAWFYAVHLYIKDLIWFPFQLNVYYFALNDQHFKISISLFKTVRQNIVLGVCLYVCC